MIQRRRLASGPGLVLSDVLGYCDSIKDEKDGKDEKDEKKDEKQYYGRNLSQWHKGIYPIHPSSAKKPQKYSVQRIS